ncbi:MAG: helix-turn-helix domain-containing protein [Candidatus Diapherotrites archaeon]
MSLMQAACLKASKEDLGTKFSESHAKVLCSLLKFEELFLDELIELTEIEESKLKKILEDLIEEKMIERINLKYKALNPVDSVFSLIKK